MRVFISWSGDVANSVAKILNQWLPLVIQEVQVFTSSVDIPKGGRWSNAISEELDNDSEGVVVVTSDNQHAPWLNFEAGALAKSVADASVRPVLFDLSSAEVTGPLSQFQHTVLSSEEDMLELVRSINARCATPLPQDRLLHTFQREWKDLNDQLAKVRSSQADAKSPTEGSSRSPDDMLEELLVRVRRMEREEIGRDDQSDSLGDVRSVARVLEQSGRLEEALHLYRNIAEQSVSTNMSEPEFPRRMRPSDASQRGAASVRFKDGRLGTLRLPQPLAEQLQVRLDDGQVVQAKFAELILLAWTPRMRDDLGSTD